MAGAVKLEPIVASEKREFLEMALLHFRELNPRFEPLEEWKAHYFETVQARPACSLCWILMDTERVGFILFGIEPHRFLPWRIGMVYELFILPAWRRRGLGEASARIVVRQLMGEGVRRVQIEVMQGNAKATALWKKLGFQAVSERYASTGPV